MSWRCPNHGPQSIGKVCGGDEPYFRRNIKEDLPNIYFNIDLDTEEATGQGMGELPFILDKRDFKSMVEHALANGCINEPTCIYCGSFLKEN